MTTFIFLVSSTFYLPSAQGANPVLIKRADFNASRDGKSVDIEWYRSGDERRYTIYVGSLFLPGENIDGKKYPVRNYEQINFAGANGESVYRLIYKKENKKVLAGTPKWVFNQRFNNIDDSLQAVFLVSNDSSYDFRTIVDRDGSLAGRGNKFLCNMATVGLPASASIFKFSQFTLGAISLNKKNPASAAAGTLQTLLSDFAIYTGAEQIMADTFEGQIQAADLVKGNVSLLADKNLLTSAGLKIGDNMKFDIAGRTIQYAKIEKIVQKSDKYLIVLSTASTIIEAKDLLNTLRNSSKVYGSSQRTCVALN
jgi:hypothetical protein